MSLKRADSIKKVVSEKPKIVVPKDDNMDPITIAAILVYFGSCIYLISTFGEIDLPFVGLSKMLCLFFGLSLLIPIKWYRKRLTISVYEFIIFNLIAVAPVLCSFVLIINSSITGDSYIETYKIEKYEVTERTVFLVLEDNAYEDKKYLRTVNLGDEISPGKNEFISIRFSDGLFGIRLIKSKRIH